jgi:hypothetical protein
VQPDEAVAGLVRGCETKPQEWPCSLSHGSMSKGRLTLPQPDGDRKRRRLVVRPVLYSITPSNQRYAAARLCSA